MLPLLSAFSLSTLVPARTGILFPATPINLTAHPLCYGGYFPIAINLTIPSVPHLNTTFPATCRRIIVSTRTGDTLDLTSAIRWNETCVWYVTQPARASFVVRVRGDAKLVIDSVDGLPVGQTLTEGRFEIDVNRELFYRWYNGPSSTDSVSSLRLTPRTGSPQYRSQVYADFEPGEKPEYFTEEGT
jgi:hypothetical protein